MVQIKNILLVGDEEDLRGAVSEQLLITEEFHVVEASSGKEALELVLEESFDIIVLYHNMIS